MAEYLKKENVIHLLEHNDKVIHYIQRTANKIVDRTVQSLCEVVNEMPAADVQPVKRGKWICTNDYETLAYGTLHYNRCSVCGEESLETGSFCPNCGARMDGDTNG